MASELELVVASQDMQKLYNRCSYALSDTITYDKNQLVMANARIAQLEAALQDISVMIARLADGQSLPEERSSED